MGFDYAAIAAKAARAIRAARGKTPLPWFLERATGEADPVEGELTAPGVQRLSISGVRTRIGTGYIATSEVLEGDELVVLDAAREPRASDRFIDERGSWTIVQIDTKNPAGIVLAYILRVRK